MNKNLKTNPMKTIAVLTDLSKSAEHATHFALHMARKMKAGVLLFHDCPVPAARQLAYAGEQEPEADEHLLIDHARRMSHDLAKRSFTGSYLPEIRTYGKSTEIVDIMTEIMHNEEICLIVTAPVNGMDPATYLTGDICNRIIDWATVPVLVVPDTAPLRNFEKIAFASQLHEEDINAIEELGSLLESFAAELMVAHLNRNPSDQHIRGAEEELNRELYRKLNCGGVYFRSIPDVISQKNWEWLKANKHTDLLAVMQQSREQMAALFKRGQNREVTYHLNLPVMILPKRP
ncbi:universal stress protein [Mucilaginibacter sp. S1162]|uniref:Universal stress protein n=1 Tax=Mucilaginibacter humi TaxID=2732510 RepID=A0ABX1W1L3_9SPHI|nr:universal stress protein [Mucilaginibacter humi]NNU33124.1 universal stress protein [Mucilaginibacter humi]